MGELINFPPIKKVSVGFNDDYVRFEEDHQQIDFQSRLLDLPPRFKQGDIITQSYISEHIYMIKGIKNGEYLVSLWNREKMEWITVVTMPMSRETADLFFEKLSDKEMIEKGIIRGWKAFVKKNLYSMASFSDKELALLSIVVLILSSFYYIWSSAHTTAMIKQCDVATEMEGYKACVKKEVGLGGMK